MAAGLLVLVLLPSMVSARQILLYILSMLSIVKRSFQVAGFSFPNDWYKIRQMMEERRKNEEVY